MKKRLLSLVLTFLMVFNCLPIESFAADYITKEVDGKTKYYQYKEKTVTVNTENHYDVWHTSDGKWKIGNTGTVVSDSYLSDSMIGGITGYLNQNIDKIGFSVKILRTPEIATI